MLVRKSKKKVSGLNNSVKRYSEKVTGMGHMVHPLVGVRLKESIPGININLKQQYGHKTHV